MENTRECKNLTVYKIHYKFLSGRIGFEYNVMIHTAASSKAFVLFQILMHFHF